ncbi:TPA: ferredoxin oxidoreductase [Candidatus Acetothermia bacterium]|nr:ferredoxin oxidoreductase [Candidatus Acetothermia bacterium]
MPKREVVSAERIFFEAPRERKYLIGNEAVAEAVKRANVDMVIVYPITPQSEATHIVGDLYARGYVKEYYRGEDEFNVMSAVAGAAMGGVRVFTATSGPGTLRAFEMFPTWAGMRLPIVCAFMTRGVNSPLTIQPDNIEIGWLADTGMLIFHAEDPQDFFDMILQAYVIAEQPEVHLPVGVCVDGFFVTHTRETVELPPENEMLPPYDPSFSPVVTMDMETVPLRHMKDPFVMKSNYISYNAHASWQQEVRAAAERARKHITRYMGSPVEAIHPEAEILFMASGTAAAQARVAMERMRGEGMDIGLVKIKVLRPFPEKEIAELAEGPKVIIVPEHNITGWLARDIKSRVNNNAKIYSGPRVFGGMTMPPEVIVEETKKLLLRNAVIA